MAFDGFRAGIGAALPQTRATEAQDIAAGRIAAVVADSPAQSPADPPADLPAAADDSPARREAGAMVAMAAVAVADSAAPFGTGPATPGLADLTPDPGPTPGPTPGPETAPGAGKGGGGTPGGRATSSLPTDTLFDEQWHLHNTGQSGGTAGVDLNVLPVWDDFTGAGVHVGIWDDGVQYTHPDLAANYDASRHIPDSGGIHDPLPQDVDSEHGTSVAGVIAAARNGSGTVGVAYDASITGVDMFYDPDLDLNDSLMHLRDFDVTNHSWGWTTGFYSNLLDSAAEFSDFFDGFFDSVANGRGGLGTINLAAAGNDRAEGRHTNDSNFTSISATIAVAAVGHDGLVSDYSTPGSSILISAPSSGPAGSGIWTTDRTGADGYSNGSNEPGNSNASYTNDFGGTSSATPAAAGVVALMLEANPGLGWRDVQTILAHTARHTGSAVGSAPAGDEIDRWSFNGADSWNGGGLHFSNDYGFGLIDALAAVRLAESWTGVNTSANRVGTVADTWSGSLAVPDNNPTGVSVNFTVTAGMEIEDVGLQLTLGTGAWLGDYYITLTSPDGTVSELSYAQNGSGDDSNTPDWFYMSRAFRGESGVGTWRLDVSDRWATDFGTLTHAELEFYGAATSASDTYVFSNEYSDYVGISGHTRGIIDTNGGTDTLNLSAVSSASTVVLGDGGIIDGVTIGSFRGNGPQITGIENVVGGDGNDSFTGDAGENRLWGWRGDDKLYGDLGKDTLFGGEDDDKLWGGSGRDTLHGNSGDDRLDGGADNDRLFGSTGRDTLFGGAGRDQLDGGSAADSMAGGDGSDLYWIDNVGDTITEIAANGNDLVYSTISLNLATLSQHVERAQLLGTGNLSLTGNARNNELTGTTGNNLLSGSNGEDKLFGSDGNDDLYGGADDDLLVGGNGSDDLWGGSGADNFRFSNGFGVDRIHDFDTAAPGEVIDFSLVNAITSWTDLLNNHLGSNGSGDATITVGANVLTLIGVSAASLGAGDFVF
jgi:subtilisin-like proprotein convertase family protein